MRIRCQQCSNNFSWSRPVCPRCGRGNGWAPGSVVIKVAILAAASIAVGLVCQYILECSDPGPLRGAERIEGNRPAGRWEPPRPDPKFGVPRPARFNTNARPARASRERPKWRARPRRPAG